MSKWIDGDTTIDDVQTEDTGMGGNTDILMFLGDNEEEVSIIRDVGDDSIEVTIGTDEYTVVLSDNEDIHTAAVVICNNIYNGLAPDGDELNS